MKEKFLPVGSVVLLNGGTKKIMITGFCTMISDEPDSMFDYCGCLYPEGIIRSDQNCVFNHDQISEIFFMGYESDEEKKFKENLNSALKEENKSEKSSNIERLNDEIEKL